MNNNASAAAINLDIVSLQDFITENSPAAIAEYACETSASTDSLDYNLAYSFEIESDGSVLDYATVTPETATFTAECIADASTGTAINLVENDFIVKSFTVTPALIEAAENAYNLTGLSIFMETLNHDAITQ